MAKKKKLHAPHRKQQFVTSPATPAQRAQVQRLVKALAFETFACPRKLDTQAGLVKLLTAIRDHADPGAG